MIPRIPVMSLLVCLSTAAFAQDKPEQPIAEEEFDIVAAALAAEPMSYEQLSMMYANKTWIWDTGAGFFANSKRRFTSIGAEETNSRAEGTWFVPRKGRLCFRANWMGDTGDAVAVTCFSHRIAEGVIYQKKEPDGDWYVFKNSPVRKDDQFMKLKPGDYVTASLKKRLADNETGTR